MEFKKKAKNARAFIVLLAALITEILNIKYDREILNSMIILLVVIIVFIVIATVAIRLIEMICNMESAVKKEDIEDFDEDSDEENKDMEINGGAEA